MKRLILYAAMLVATISLQAQGNNGYNSNNGYTNQVDCSNLNTQEKQFANRLSQDNKMIFCNQMNSMQRSKCMRMMGQMDDYGNPMTPDMAVMSVAQDMGINNNSMMQPDCSNLTMQEKRFATRLTDDNKMIFCNQMTAAQRSRCMKMVGQVDDNGNPMTEDDTVMMVYQGMSTSNGNMMNQADCSNLNMQEKRFAARLNDTNKMIFCNQMNASQRSECMRMMGGMDEEGNLITEDQAVMMMSEGMTSSNNTNNTMGQSDCSNLNMQEKRFAARLNSTNKMVFCNQLTPAQRAKAMKMVGQMDDNGNPLTENGAVVAVSQSMSNGNPTGNCSSMTRAEQLFSNQLNSTNKATFCNKLTPQQRSKAMSLTGQLDANGVPMSADKAVMKVAQEKMNQPSGACPVK